VTDHSRSSVQANGLSVERLRAQREAIEDAREQFGRRSAILHGSEVDILADGSLDYDDETLPGSTSWSRAPTRRSRRTRRRRPPGCCARSPTRAST
jgi:hypothetical protein